MPQFTTDTDGRFHHRRLQDQGDLLSRRLCRLHSELLTRVPGVDRISCALYEPETDLLRTFADSTRRGVPLTDYEVRLSEVPSLRALATSRQYRNIDDIQSEIGRGSQHSRWLLDQGYRSSFTVPLHDPGRMRGFVFYNSMQPAAFDDDMQHDLLLYSLLINIAILATPEDSSSIVPATHIARDFTGLRDFDVGTHLDRMAQLAELIASGLMATHGLNEGDVKQIGLFARLHDIGKIGIPDKILYRPGPLDPEERATMRKHVDNGIEIVDMILETLQLRETSEARLLCDIVSCHHELLDGSGYPRGLSRDSIPLAARIAAVADVFDALTSSRPYKRGWTSSETFAELERLVALEKLDGHCVAALLRRREEADAIVGARPSDGRPEGRLN